MEHKYVDGKATLIGLKFLLEEYDRLQSCNVNMGVTIKTKDDLIKQLNYEISNYKIDISNKDNRIKSLLNRLDDYQIKEDNLKYRDIEGEYDDYRKSHLRGNR